MSCLFRIGRRNYESEQLVKQTQALDVMKLGHNVFLTGEPGSGKTHTLNQFIDYCREHNIGIGITASTGIAATHLGGMTIHSWSGMGINKDLSEEQLERLGTRAQLKSRFKRTRVLIIDEVSMLEGARLDLINRICKRFKNSEKPFGGLQVILCGDLFQLPPIGRGDEQADFAHNSPSWSELCLKICYLSEQYRQDLDPGMLELLRSIRAQELDENMHQRLRGRLEEVSKNPDLTRLYSHNYDVDNLNNKRLASIEGESKSFGMHTSGKASFIEQLQKSCLAPETLELKVGAQVLCVANNPELGYMNGTRGEVVGFESNKPLVLLSSGRTVAMERYTWKIEDGERTLAEISQYPLRLAWAITVHKSQGMSLDSAEIDLSRAFTPGMGYVALSRLRTLEGLYLRGLNEMALTVSSEIKRFDEYLSSQSRKVTENLATFPRKKLDSIHQHIRTNLASDYAEYDKELFAALKSWRTEQSRSEKLPAYRIFDDKTLIALSAERPGTHSELSRVPGIGPKKLEDYGDAVLKIITRYTGKLL